MLTTALLFSLIFIGLVSIVYWLGTFASWLMSPHNLEELTMHQYEVTIQGKHADEFLPLLENISRTHKRYYGDTVRVLEIIDPTVSREVTV